MVYKQLREVEYTMAGACTAMTCIAVKYENPACILGREEGDLQRRVSGVPLRVRYCKHWFACFRGSWTHVEVALEKGDVVRLHA